MEKKTEPVVVVIDLLKELRSAWFEINKKSKSQPNEQNKPSLTQQDKPDTLEKRINITTKDFKYPMTFNNKLIDYLTV